MDTISLNLYGSKQELEMVINMIEDKNYPTDGIKKLKNETTKPRAYITIKLSYPKYFANNNAYLIQTREEGYIVQENFVEKIRGYGIDIFKLEYKVNRVDIPFTCLMKEGEEFNNYTNVFYYMALIGKRKGIQSIKSIEDFIEKKNETIIFSNASNSKSTNKKLTIYNQKKRMVDTYNLKKNREMDKEYPELKRRIRLEIMKRVKMIKAPLRKFKDNDLIGCYYKSYKNMLLSFFDEDILKDILEEEANYFAKMLLKRSSKFRWENFIYENMNQITSYESMRRAINKIGLKIKSKESAISTVRRTISKVDKNENVNRLEMVKKFKELKSQIEKSNLLD